MRERILNLPFRLGLVVVGLALLVMVGWWLDVPVLRNFHPGFVATRFNTALALALAGLALMQRGWRRPLALLVASLALANGVEYLSGWELGVDEFLVADTTPEGSLPPGRMAPATVVNFLGFAVSLLLLESGSPIWQRVGQALTLAVAGLALVSLQGHLFSLAAFYTLVPFVQTAIPTALGFLLLALGLLASQPDVGFMARLTAPVDSARWLRTLLPALILLPLLNGLLHLVVTQAGLVTPEFGLLLYFTANLAMLGGLVLWVGSSLVHRELLQRQSETRLAETRQRLEALVRQSPLGLIEWDLEGRVREWNPAAEQIFGYSREEMLGLPGQRLLAGGESEFDSIWSTLLAEEKPHRYDQNLTRDGRTIECEWLNAVLRDMSGRPLGVASICRDVTAARAQEKQLRMLWRALEQSPLSVVITDERGGIEYVNPGFTSLTGYSAEESSGRNPEALLGSGQHPPQFHADLSETVLRGEQWDGEYCIRKKDGELCWTWARIAQVHDADGRLTNFVSFSQDITERKLLEQQAAQGAEERQARLAAEGANRLKTEFLANVSHEIRTPLHTILGMAHLAGGTELDERQRYYLENIESAGHSLLRIINDILDLSKLEVGRLDVQPSRFGLHDLLYELRGTLGPAAAEKSLPLLFTVAPEVPDHVVGDPERLRQVLTNLISNAIKFTERGQVEVRLRSATVEEGSLLLEVSIQDTGSGMSPEQIGKLFVPFCQGDGSPTRQHGGAGLGLALSKRLVELMGGEIRVHSVPGEGSVFTFTCPLGRAQDGPGGTAPPRPGPPARLNGGRVLVVEDHLVNQQIAREMLESAGLQVGLAGTGREALERVKTGGPWALVLMDLQMPEMDGYEATRAIRALPGLSGLPIVAMTAHALPEERGRCLAAGMDDYLAKPIDPETFYGTVGKWLEMAPRAPGPTEFPAIAGVDVQAGLVRLAGNAERYRQLLRQALAEWERILPELETAWRDRELTRVQADAHRLRGVAANLGLEEVARLAGQLEGGAGAETLQALAAELERVGTGARQVLAEEDSAGRSSLAPGRLAGLLRQLDAHLRANEGDALDCLGELRAAGGPDLDPALWARLTRSVEAFDFEAARAALQEVAARAPGGPL